jgi:hypothetical protein
LFAATHNQPSAADPEPTLATAIAIRYSQIHKHVWENQMEASKLLNWLQLAGTFGILVGMILVGVQISQATELTRLQMDNEWLSKFEQRYTMMVGEAPAEVLAKAIDDPESLTTADIVVLENYIGGYLEYWWTIKRFADEGLVDDERWHEITDSGSQNYIFGHAFGKAWWISKEKAGLTWGDEEFDAVVTNAIKDIEPTDLRKWHDFIRQNLRELTAGPPPN